MADGKKDRVGIIGAGRMGLSMLKHLVKKGYRSRSATSARSSARLRAPLAHQSRRLRPKSAR